MWRSTAGFRCICGEVQQGLGVYVEKYSRV